MSKEKYTPSTLEAFAFSNKKHKLMVNYVMLFLKVSRWKVNKNFCVKHVTKDFWRRKTPWFIESLQTCLKRKIKPLKRLFSLMMNYSFTCTSFYFVQQQHVPIGVARKQILKRKKTRFQGFFNELWKNLQPPGDVGITAAKSIQS